MSEIVEGDGEIRCKACGVVLGQLIRVGAGDLLLIGQVIHRNAHGFCGSCGEPFHWSVTDMMMQKIIERAQNNRKY